MIRGNQMLLESEINEFLRTEAFQCGLYQVERKLSSTNELQEPSYLLYIGAGMAAKPTFIIGICNRYTDQGAVIISHFYKPRSFMMAFTEAVKELFAETSLEYKHSILTEFGQLYKQLVERAMGQAVQSEVIELDLSELGIFIDTLELEKFLKRERTKG
jgi:hypothetical protein